MPVSQVPSRQHLICQMSSAVSSTCSP